MRDNVILASPPRTHSLGAGPDRVRRSRKSETQALAV